ncbi:MAG: HxsD-like protein [Candidatus Gracilibacteria bacterium]
MKKEFKIDSEIYSEKIIKEAIGDFEGVTKIELEKNLLIIEGKSTEEIDEVFNELMNYVISLEC